jgi:hypothetical protein
MQNDMDWSLDELLELEWSDLPGGIHPIYQNLWKIIINIRRQSKHWERIYSHEVIAVCDYPYLKCLMSSDQVLFYQYCLTKGLPLELRVPDPDMFTCIGNFPLFWMLQNVKLSNYVIGGIPGIFNMVWLFQVVPSMNRVMSGAVTVEDRELIKRYDNIDHAAFRNFFRFAPIDWE